MCSKTRTQTESCAPCARHLPHDCGQRTFMLEACSADEHHENDVSCWHVYVCSHVPPPLSSRQLNRTEQETELEVAVVGLTLQMHTSSAEQNPALLCFTLKSNTWPGPWHRVKNLLSCHKYIHQVVDRGICSSAWVVAVHLAPPTDHARNP